MKKLIIAAAIVCAAVASQAASVTWQITGASSSDQGRTVYILTSIAESYKDIGAFTDSAVGSGSVVRSGPNYKVLQTTSENTGITTTANFYLAVLAKDSKSFNYIDVTTDMRALVYTPPAGSPGTFSTRFATITGGTSKGIGGEPEPTPEPTSAMLLLLGVAGLALRRKQK